MISFLKIAAPLFLYSLGALAFFLSLTGKVKYGILFLLPMFPLENIFVKLYQFPFGNDFSNIILAGMAIGWVFQKLSRNEPIFVKNPFNTILFLYCIYTYIGLWKGSMYLGFPAPLSLADPRVKIWKNYVELFLIYFIVVNNVKDLKQIKILIVLMVFAMLLTNYYTVDQIRWTSGIESRIRINGTFVNLGPNEVASFYATYTFVLLGIFLFDKVKIRRILFISVIILNSFCALFLYSRGAYAGIAVGLAVLFFLKKRALLIPLLALGLFWQALLPVKVVDRIKQTETEEGQLDPSAQHRLDLWEDALNLFKQDPIMGVGFCVVPYAGLRGGFKDTHNIYMKILAEQGLIGLLFFLSLFGLSIKNSWSLYKKSNDNFLKGLGLGFTICVVATMVTNFFGDRFTHLQLGTYYWTFLGLVVAGNIITQKQLKTNPTRRSRVA